MFDSHRPYSGTPGYQGHNTFDEVLGADAEQWEGNV